MNTRPKNTAKDSTIARFRGLRTDGTERWEGRFSVADPQRPGCRQWHQRSGFKTKTDAEKWAKVEQAQFLSGAKVPEDRRRTGVTFAIAADEWLRWVAEDRNRKPSTLRDYRSVVEHHLKPAFPGDLRDVTTARIERWLNNLDTSPRTRNKLLTNLYGVFERARKVYGTPTTNPVADIERPEDEDSGDIARFEPDEVYKLIDAAKTPLDGTIYLTAAFTGLRRGELIALRWRDVDFENEAIRVRASYAAGEETTPKSGKVRSVPMEATVLTALRRWQAAYGSVPGDDDLVFTLSGDYLDGDALGKRYKRARDRAGLRPLTFHDLRHTFGTLAVRRASIFEVQQWMGHADIKTTQRYLHYQPRGDEAKRLSGAFAPTPTGNVVPLRRPDAA